MLPYSLLAEITRPLKTRCSAQYQLHAYCRMRISQVTEYLLLPSVMVCPSNYLDIGFGNAPVTQGHFWWNRWSWRLGEVKAFDLSPT
jgi:hypothetical protein